MNELFGVDEGTDANVPSVVPARDGRRGSGGYAALMVLAWILIVAALLMGVILLVDDLIGSSVPWLEHAPISAAPLLLIGAGSLVFQVLMRPRLDRFSQGDDREPGLYSVGCRSTAASRLGCDNAG